MEASFREVVIVYRGLRKVATPELRPEVATPALRPEVATPELRPTEGFSTGLVTSLEFIVTVLFFVKNNDGIWFNNRPLL